MKRGGLLLLLMLLMIAGACQSSGGGGSAQLAGSVLDTSGNPIAGAAIVAGGVNGASGASGTFNLINISSGTVAVSVTASGYFTLDINLPVAPGMNNADFTLETCIVGTANCSASPTPTVTASGTPTPAPGYNVTAWFMGNVSDGTNAPAWTGSAQLMGGNGGNDVRTFGDGNQGGNAQNDAFILCYVTGSDPIQPVTSTLNSSDTCSAVWFGEGQGKEGGNNAEIELDVQGDIWAVGGFVSFTSQTSGIEASYNEGPNTQGNYEPLQTASAGQFFISNPGYLSGTQVEIDGGYFNIPNLP